MRIGKASDIHQLVKGRALILGGVKIDYHKGALGHSDADVLIHAIGESILGALALRDLGTHFSDSDNRYKDMDSMWMLKQIYQMMVEHNYCIGNIDSTIIIEQPKIARYIPQMTLNIANALCCNIDQINVKATRGEGMGFIGRGEGVFAESVCLLEKSFK